MSGPRFGSPLAWVVAAFVASRALSAALGVRFDSGITEHVWHVLDRDLLRDRLWESLFYLHSQPPLFNLFLGAGYRLPEALQAGAFQLAYLAMGLALAVGLFRLMARLGLDERLAAGLAIACSVSPACLLYEQWLHYTHPVAAAIALSALALHRAMRRPDVGRWAVFFGLLAAVALTRPLYHLGWLVLIAGALAMPWSGLDGPARRRMLVGAAGPLLLVLALYAKNALVFGTFSASSWLGMNVQRITLGQAPPGEKARLVRDRVISPLGAHAAFQPLATYPPPWGSAAPTGIDALDRTHRTDGQPNFNHQAYLGISAQFRRDAVALVRHEPLTYLKGVARAVSWYVRPASDYGLLEPNRTRMAAWDALYDKLVFGCWLKAGPSWPVHDVPAGVGLGRRLFLEHRNIGWHLLLALPALWVFGLRHGLARRREDPAGAATVLYLVATIAFVTVLGLTLDLGENNRFRFDADPPLVVLAGLATRAAWHRWHARRAPGARPDERPRASA